MVAGRHILGAQAARAKNTGRLGPGGTPIAFFLSIMDAIEAREQFAHSRARNVALYSVITARSLLLPAVEVNAVRIGALLSNIGMLNVPERILHKTEKLTAEEQEAVRRHPEHGVEILAGVPELKNILPMVRYHHEHYNGTGYPSGLRGEEIPLGARIIRIAETYDALLSERPYRPAYSSAKALEILAVGSGEEFDPRIVHAFQVCMRRGPLKDDVLDRWEEERASARTRRNVLPTSR